jgi:hypothetical protein
VGKGFVRNNVGQGTRVITPLNLLRFIYFTARPSGSFSTSRLTFRSACGEQEGFVCHHEEGTHAWERSPLKRVRNCFEAGYTAHSQLENKHRSAKPCIGDCNQCVFSFSSNRIVLRATIESTHWLATLSQLDSRLTRNTEICGTARTINFQVLNNSTPDLDEQYQLMACSAHY